jgi:hypothetical protein
MMRESQLIRKRHTVLLYHGILLPDLLRRILQKKIVVHGDVMESALSNKESKHLDEWHDFSQISAGNEKDKLTPLSQIGFRDPASIGGGQQLTILSMEVLLHSFLFCSQYMYCLFFIH